MSALETYLKYYETRVKPGYAVLVTGAWGVGKTFQVREALKVSRPFYVSLFGLQSAAEVYETIFAEMFPEAAQLKEISKGAQETKIAGIPVGAFASQFVGLFTRERADNARTLILDDLERSKVGAEELLGIINRYVEHHGCRVVVIAHEGKLAAELQEQKEKVFGQTVAVTADIDGAYAAFAANLEDAEGTLQKHKAEIIHLFRQSEVQSLRILRHVMEDSTRLIACLSNDQKLSADATSSLVKFVSALNLDIRFRRLARSDIKDRRAQIDLGASTASDKQKVLVPIYATSRRFPDAQIEYNFVSDSVLESILFDGVFVARDIVRDLARTHYYSPAKKLPDWMVVYNFQGYSDHAVQQSIDRIERGFVDRIFNEPGEILHIFAIRLLLSVKGIINRSKGDICTECKEYVDDLRARGTLRPSSMQPSPFTDDIRSGYQQYGFWVEEEYAREFGELKSYLVSLRNEALANQLPKEAALILQAVRESGTKLFELINHTASGEPRYGDVPILAAVPADEFVDAWLNCPPDNWYWIKSALNDRMKRTSPSLASEKEWLVTVIARLEASAKSSNPLTAYRIKIATPALPTSNYEDNGFSS